MTDSFLEDETRRLLAVAAGDLPAGGDDLAVRVQRRAAGQRLRRRVAMSAGAFVTAGAVAAGLLAGLVGPTAPSAYAAVVAAVTTSTNRSFEITTITTGTTLGGTPGRMVSQGKYDLARGVGEFADGRVLFAGGNVYTWIPPAHQPHGKQWYKGPGPVWLPIDELWIALPPGQGAKATPQTLLSLLKAADSVRETGTTAQGWTVYAFTVSRSDAPFDGTITVDQRGLVRQFVFNDQKLVMGYMQSGQPMQLIRSEADFSDYGIPVSVTVPPDSACILPH